MSGFPEPTRPWEGDARSDYRAWAQEIFDRLVGLGGDVAEAIVPANEALLEGDRDRIEPLVGRHSAVARRCRDLENECYAFIAREAPVGGDLRHIVAVVRSLTDIERTSKLLAHIVLSLVRVHPLRMDERLRTIVAGMAEDARAIFCGGLSAWESFDALAINELERADDAVDDAELRLLDVLYTGRHQAEVIVTLALIGRYYERLADHGVALARHISWAITGDRGREER